MPSFTKFIVENVQNLEYVAIFNHLIQQSKYSQTPENT